MQSFDKIQSKTFVICTYLAKLLFPLIVIKNKKLQFSYNKKAANYAWIYRVGSFDACIQQVPYV